MGSITSKPAPVTSATQAASKPSQQAQPASPAPQAPTYEQLQAQLASLQGQVANLQAMQASRPGSLPTWQGFSCTSLIRAMYHKGGYAPGSINRVLVAMGIVCSPATITTQRQAAKGGKAGAALTAAQWAQVQALLQGAGQQAHNPGQQPIAAPIAITKVG